MHLSYFGVVSDVVSSFIGIPKSASVSLNIEAMFVPVCCSSKCQDVALITFRLNCLSD